MGMPGRQFSAGSAYRYGFNGKENDNDVTVQDYGLRIYNPALGKFLSVDPLTSEFPELTPYQFASNSPIEAIDLDGAEAQSSKQANENSTQKPQQPSLLEQLDGALLGGQYKHERKVNALEVGIKQQTEEVSRYKDLKQQAMNDLMSAAPGSPEAKASLNLYSQYDKEQQAHVSNLRSLILQRYKSLGEDKAIANYQDVLDKQLSILAFGTNAMVTAASFIPSGGSSAGFFSLTGVGTKGLTGGTEQWLRFGYSYSRVGQTPTIALRWGAGGRFSQTISSSLLRSANETLRTRRLIPGLRTWWNEPGHLHLMKMPTKEFTLKLIWNNTKSLF